MSYDIRLKGKDGETCKLPCQIMLSGGTVACDKDFNQLASTTAEVNITYNYSKFFYCVVDDIAGIRWLYGKTGAETTAKLAAAILSLNDELPDADYWKATEGNARVALGQLLVLARLCPEGIWEGD